MREFSVDMIPGGAQTAVACNQFESGDTWVFALYYDGGRYSIPADAEVSITGTKPDGAAYNIAGTVTDNAVVIEVTEQMTACAGRSIAEILVESETDGTTLYSANFPLLVEPAAVQADLSPSEIPEAITDTDGNIYYSADYIPEVTGGVPTEVRQAMLALFKKAPYFEAGLADEVAVVQAWAEATTGITVSPSTASVSSASPTAQLSAVTTPAGGAVTWASSNTAVATVSSTGLVTAVGNGTATITATSGTVSASCAVTVTGFSTLTGIEAVYTQSGTVYDTASLDDLKADLVVTGTYDDSSTAVITDYTLSGTLAEGTSTVTVGYGGLTDTFTVTVSPAPLVPSAYQQVEYIKATGTQHIQTEVVALVVNDATIENSILNHSADIDCAFDEWQSAYATNIVFSCGSTGGNWFGYLNAKTAIGMGTSTGNYFTSGTLTDRHQYHWSWSGTTASIERDDEAVISRAYAATGQQNRPFAIFTAISDGSSSSNYHFNGKVYRVTLYKSGAKVCDLIPCYRKSDDEIGMYDIVNDVFYTNTGTGTFQKGGNV